MEVCVIAIVDGRKVTLINNFYKNYSTAFSRMLELEQTDPPVSGEYKVLRPRGWVEVKPEDF